MQKFLFRYGFLIVIVALFSISAVYFPKVYILLTYEDLFGEWAQTLFFAAAAIYSWRVFYEKSEYRWFFLALALSCFYVTMEEISWGQRLFNIDTPEFFKEHNQQREMNLHNLLTGPSKSDTKTFLEYAISVCFIAYGFFYPLLLKYRFKIALFVERVKIPAPPLFLCPYFILVAFLEPEPFHFNEAELAELLAAIALSLLAVHYWTVNRYQLDAHHSDHWEAYASERYQRSLLELFIMIPAMAVLITGISYQVPDIQKKIDQRLMNGYKKFALRYQSYEQWETANELLLTIYEKKPGYTSNLRRIARNYRKMGDMDGFHKYNSKAIKASLRRREKYPKSIMSTLSLAKSYRQRGDQAKAEEYGKKAFDLALSHAKKKLNSASRAFWLAQTMEFQGLYKEANLQYKKATVLNPYSSTYKKAYERSKKHLID